MSVSTSNEEPQTEEIMANYEDPPSPEYSSSSRLCQFNDENRNYEECHKSGGSPNGAQDSSGDNHYDFIKPKEATDKLLNNSLLGEEANGCVGFTTATGKPMAISKSSKAKVLDLFKDDMAECDEFFGISNVKSNLSRSRKFVDAEVNKNESIGFATAGGKQVTVSNVAQKRAQALFAEEEEEVNAVPREKLGVSKPIFLTGKGKTVKITESDRKQDSRLPKKDFSVSSKTSQMFFQTGTGHKVNVSDNARQAASKIFMEESKPLSGLAGAKPFSFSTCNGRTIKISEEAHRKVQSIFDEDLLPSQELPTAAQLPISQNAMEKVKDIFSDSEKKSEPVKDSIRVSKDTLDKAESMMKKLDFDLTLVRSKSMEISKASQESVKKRKIDTDEESIVKKMCFDDAFEDELDTQLLQEMEDSAVTTSVLPVTKSVKELRLSKRAAQDALMKQKNTVYRRGEGSLCKKKRQSNSRLRLKDFNILDESKINVDRSIAEITSELAADHVFIGRQYFSEETLSNKASLILGDEAEVIFDDYSNLDRDALVAAFLTSPGISRSKVNVEWARNHYRWIVWKLASYERRFPIKFKGIFHPEQILWQLRYRYDMEIEGGIRTCLRKIYEKDDVAGKAMILCVANIAQLDHEKVFMELTDGWYSIGCICQDEGGFQKAIKNYLIVCGTKLVTFGAELINHDQACAPLEAPQLIDQDIVKEVLSGKKKIPLLKLSFNSTRRARWDARLGYVPKLTMPTSLDKLVSNGGLASELTLYVARKYPLVYNSDKEMLSQRQYDSLGSRDQGLENIYQDVQREFELRESKKVRKPLTRRTSNRKEISSLYTGKEIHEAIETCPDPGLIQSMLTAAQSLALEEYQRCQWEEIHAAMRKEVESRMKVTGFHKGLKMPTPLLKLRVVDVMTESSSTLSIWRPNDDLVQGLKEGSVVKVYSVSVGHKLALKSTKMTRFERIQFEHNLQDRHDRKIQVIEEILEEDFDPLFNEVDIIGVIVHVGQLVQEFQAVYLCDAMFNFVSVQFHYGLVKHAVDSLVRVGNVINFSNLQWRKSSAGGRLFKGSEIAVPCLYAVENTLVSSDSKAPDRSTMIKELAKEVHEDFMKQANLRLGQLMKRKPRILTPSVMTPPTPLATSSSKTNKRPRPSFDPPFGVQSPVEIVEGSPAFRQHMKNQERLAVLNRYQDSSIALSNLDATPLSVRKESRLKKPFVVPFIDKLKKGSFPTE